MSGDSESGGKGQVARMAQVFVGIGSNVDKRNNIISSVRDLDSRFTRLRMSPVYESEAIGFEGDSFYNLVVSFRTRLSPEQVADTLNEVELAHGRCRGEERFVSRTLDLDQLLYDDVVLSDNGICLPHSDIMAYAHVLLPLAKLASGMVHPVERKTYAQLWHESEENPRILAEVVLPELKGFKQ